MLELLAPAGDFKSFETAVNCGADAVYLGLSDFNARRKAENFTTENIRECVKRAHFFGVKVYITVNTLVRDDEMSALISLVRAAVEARADAFLVQDLGVAQCLKKAFPNIVLHASTQLGVHNLYGAKIAEKMGFKRVVLSRETKLKDIKAIRKETNLEIEYFVQGALCVAFSGNCYLSAVEQNASGNRGLCKQLCRLPYRATVGEDSAEGYLLSAKDLCLADSVKELAEAGVTSFKIEGRLRRDGYVGSAVSVYRRIIDGIEDNSKLTKKDRADLQIAYSRGGKYLERAYLDDGTPSVIESKYNNHTGREIGAVKEVKPFKKDLYRVVITSDFPLENGDGLKFFAPNSARKNGGKTQLNDNKRTGKNGRDSGKTEWREVASLGLGDVKKCGNNEYTFVTKTALNAGWRVHIISSAARDNEVLNTVRKVPVNLDVKAVAGEPLTLSATTEFGVSTQVTGDICERAKTSPMSAKELKNQAVKTADSGFTVAECEVRTDCVFIAKSALNALRRELFSKLTEAVIREAEQDIVEIDENEISAISGSLQYKYSDINIRFVHSDEISDKSDISSFPQNENKVFALCPSEYTVREITRMLGKLGVKFGEVALQLPVIANGKDLNVIEKLLADLPELRTLVSENIYGLEFAQKGYRVIAGAGHNTLNGYAKEECERLGAQCVLPSPESAQRRGNFGEELPLMTFAHCPYKTVYGNDCTHCSYREGMTISRERKEYRVRRTRVSNCYFGLF